MLAILAERHRPLAGQPSCELLVRLDEAVASNPHQNGTQPVQHIVRAIGLGGDLRIQPNQRIPKVILDQNFVQTGETDSAVRGSASRDRTRDHDDARDQYQLSYSG